MSKQRICYTHAEIEKVMNEVSHEFDQHGLLTRGLRNAPVVTVSSEVGYMSWAHGLYIVQGRWGYDTGTIYVPRVSLVRLLERLGRRRTTLRDVLRHEFAHALAYRSGSLVRDWKRFEQVFGAHHDGEYEVGIPGDHFVTGYAATSPCEDFAETVMCYLRYGGEGARWRRRSVVFGKIELVGELAGRVGRLGLT